jgi:transcriptional regulator with XRE-family HTH domain
MAHKLDHLREKAVMLRTQKNMTLDEIVERLSLPKTTVYYWIKDIPIPRTEKQTAAQQRRADETRVRYAALRDAAYQQGWDEAPELLQDPSFRDFVVLYMAEGYKRGKNVVSFVNSDPQILALGYRWIKELSKRKLRFQLQCHIDHDENELKRYWSELLAIDALDIKTIRKSNSGKLSGRQFRSFTGFSL